MTQTRMAMLAASLALLAAPLSAERWSQPSTQTYVPVGVVPAPEPERPVRPVPDNRTVIVTNGPIIILPGQATGPQHPVGQPRHDRYLPLRCLESYTSGRDEIHLFEAECLADNGVSLRGLPNRCAVSIRTTRDLLRGYDPACLREAGFRMAGD